jgi:predicted amidohydrolase YtcJ
MLDKNRIINKLICLLLVIAFMVTFDACSTSGGNAADIVITNANVYTVDSENTVADSIAIKNGRIAYVGDADGLHSYIGENTVIKDLKGGMVLPGIVDNHMHPAMSAVTYRFEITLQDVFTVDEYLKKIQEFVDENDSLEVYVGAGFMRSSFDAVGPRKESLDRICSNKPVMITSADGHSLWINSKAMELSGITKDTPDPEGGVIQRDPFTGEPSGLLQESAMQLVEELKPAYTKEQYKEAILWLQEWFNQAGLTTVFDALIPVDQEEYYMAYQELAEEGRLTLRVRGAWHLTPEMGKDGLEQAITKGIEISEGFQTPYFQVNSFKFFADQVLEEQTAYLSQPYEGREDGWRGIKVWDDKLMEELFTRIDKEGFQIHVHQIGDASAAYTLDALEKVAAANGKRDSRHTFAHVQFVNEEDQKRMADLGMTAVIAPYWMAMDDYYWNLYVPYVGRERADRMYPAKSLIEKGMNVTTHSDFFVTEPDLGWLFYGAITRTIPDKIFQNWYEGMNLTRTADPNSPVKDGMIGPLKTADERLTLEEIVKAATYNGAYANFMENEIGSIEEGKMADLVLFSENLFALDTEEIADIAPMMTLFDGKIVHGEEINP